MAVAAATRRSSMSPAMWRSAGSGPLVQLSCDGESTGLALLGLQGLPKATLAEPLEKAATRWRETRSTLAKAWLGISLRNHGLRLPEGGEAAARETVPQDTMLAALETLACTEGNHRLLGPEAKV